MSDTSGGCWHGCWQWLYFSLSNRNTPQSLPPKMLRFHARKIFQTDIWFKFAAYIQSFYGLLFFMVVYRGSLRSPGAAKRPNITGKFNYNTIINLSSKWKLDDPSYEPVNDTTEYFPKSKKERKNIAIYRIKKWVAYR